MTNTIGQAASGYDVVDEREIDQAEARTARVAEAAGRQAVAQSLVDRPYGRKRWERKYVLLLLGADLTAGLIAAAVANSARPADSVRRIPAGFFADKVTYPELASFSLLAWLVCLAASGAYRSKHFAVDDRDYRIPVKWALTLLVLVIMGSYASHSYLSRMMVLSFFGVLIVSVLATRGLVNLVLRYTRRHGRARARVLLVGQERTLREFADHFLTQPDHDWELVGVCVPTGRDTIDVRGQALPVAGHPDDVIRLTHEVRADGVVVTNPAAFSTLSLQQVSWDLERARVDLLVAPDAVALAGPRLKVSSLHGLPVIKVTHTQHESVLRSVYFWLSRLVGAALLLVTSPLLLGVAVAIKLGSPGPVLYRQKRVGYKGEEFEMLKFRSMIPNADELLDSLLELNEHDGALFKMRDDPRITRVGRILRKYSLDELPQLINVVKGDMSLVGPRPCLAREMTMFGEAEHRRFMVHPGMTGLWQVSGRADLPWSDAVKTDLYYVDNWTPALDIRILAQTARVVLAGHGC